MYCLFLWLFYPADLNGFRLRIRWMCKLNRQRARLLQLRKIMRRWRHSMIEVVLDLLNGCCRRITLQMRRRRIWMQRKKSMKMQWKKAFFFGQMAIKPDFRHFEMIWLYALGMPVMVFLFRRRNMLFQCYTALMRREGRMIFLSERWNVVILMSIFIWWRLHRPVQTEEPGCAITQGLAFLVKIWHLVIRMR